MDGKEFIEALRSGKRLYGTLIVSTSPKWLKAVTGLGLDCVFIDTEHTPLDWYELGWMCRAYRLLGMATLVRIPHADPHLARRVLYVGATGVICAYVETAEEVNQLRGAVKLRPLKGRKLEKILAGRAKLEGEMAEYVPKFNEDSALLVNIESVPAVEALDEILAVPGLDGVLIGPHDLSCSLGVPEQYDHPLFDEAVMTIITKARAKNVGVAMHNMPRVDQDIKYGKAGINLILRRSDIELFRTALHEDLTKLRQSLGESASDTELGDLVI